MNFGAQLKAFLENPVDPNNDGKTDLMEWIAFFGLIAVLAIGWNRVLKLIFSDGAK